MVHGPGKHSIYTRFPKDRNCDMLSRTKITKASCRRGTGTVVPKAENFGDLKNRGSQKFPVKDVDHDKITDTLLWYKIWQHSGYNHTRAKQKLLRRPRRAYKKSWSRRENQKSFTLTIPQNLESFVKNYSGIIVRQHHTDQKRMGLLREQLRKEHLRYCCSQVWKTNGGRIPWNATAIF